MCWRSLTEQPKHLIAALLKLIVHRLQAHATTIGFQGSHRLRQVAARRACGVQQRKDPDLLRDTSQFPYRLNMQGGLVMRSV